MKTYTDAERYQALRKFTILANTDNDRAEEISAKLPHDPGKVIDDAAFDKVMDALCEAMHDEQ
jgi:hypothetical protein